MESLCRARLEPERESARLGVVGACRHTARCRVPKTIADGSNWKAVMKEVGHASMESEEVSKLIENRDVLRKEWRKIEGGGLLPITPATASKMLEGIGVHPIGMFGFMFLAASKQNVLWTLRRWHRWEKGRSWIEAFSKMPYVKKKEAQPAAEDVRKFYQEKASQVREKLLDIKSPIGVT